MEFDYNNPGKSMLKFEEQVKEHFNKQGDEEYIREDHIADVCLLALSDLLPEEAAKKLKSK